MIVIVIELMVIGVHRWLAITHGVMSDGRDVMMFHFMAGCYRGTRRFIGAIFGAVTRSDNKREREKERKKCSAWNVQYESIYRM